MDRRLDSSKSTNRVAHHSFLKLIAFSALLPALTLTVKESQTMQQMLAHRVERISSKLTEEVKPAKLTLLSSPR